MTIYTIVLPGFPNYPLTSHQHHADAAEREVWLASEHGAVSPDSAMWTACAVSLRTAGDFVRACKAVQS